jgi:Domain of unknown function (DUF892)
MLAGLAIRFFLYSLCSTSCRLPGRLFLILVSFLFFPAGFLIRLWVNFPGDGALIGAAQRVEHYEIAAYGTVSGESWNLRTRYTLA